MVKKTVLVVDDSSLNIDLLVGLLSPTYKVKAAISGEKALRIVHKQAPDMILLDVLMPGMDGYELLKQLRSVAETREIPVVFISGTADPGDIQKGLDSGAQGFLGKPVDPIELQQMLVKILGE